MQEILISAGKQAAITTVLLVLAVFVLGFVLEWLQKAILRMLCRSLGTQTSWMIANRLTLLGVVHHECAHALLVLLTGAKLKQVQLFHPQGNQLGCVTWAPRAWFPSAQSIQYTLVSAAPVMAGMLSLWLLYGFVLPQCTAWWMLLLLGYVMLSIFLHMTMSSQDRRIAAKGAPACAVIVFLLAFLAELDWTALLQAL